MTKKITDLEGRLDAAFDRADKQTEDSLARLCEKQRLKIAELVKQRDSLLEAAKFVLETGITGHRAVEQSVRLRAAIASVPNGREDA